MKPTRTIASSSLRNTKYFIQTIKVLTGAAESDEVSGSKIP